MITIDQLLESVDLAFEPRFVTKDKSGVIAIWSEKPEKVVTYMAWSGQAEFVVISFIKLADFENKHWTECIYEVPRKTTGKIENLQKLQIPKSINWDNTAAGYIERHKLIKNAYEIINGLVDAVNELKATFTLPTLNPDLTDEDLRKTMRDPKYWRDKDSATIQKVRNGFNKLYGDKN